MTCIIAATNGTTSFIAGDKLGSNGFTKTVMNEPKVFEKSFVRAVDEFSKTKEVMAFGGTTSFRMLQLLDHSLKLPDMQKDVSVIQYLITSVVPAIRTLFKDEWGSKDNSQDVGGGNFIILHNHMIYEIQNDFSVLQPSTNITAVGSGTYHAIAAMQAFQIAEPNNNLSDRAEDIFKIVSKNVTSVSAEFDILKY